MGLERRDREHLLRDLNDYDDYERGSIRDIVEKLCKALGVTADLSLWDEPQATDTPCRKGTGGSSRRMGTSLIPWSRYRAATGCGRHSTRRISWGMGTIRRG
jgi:hypothetical protein